MHDLDPDRLRKLLLHASDIALRRFVEEPPGSLSPSTPAADVRAIFGEDLPQDPVSPETLLERVEQDVYGNSVFTNSPRFLHLVAAGGNPFGLLAEVLAAGLNPVVVRESVAPAATAVERQVVRWIGQFIGYAPRAEGLIVSGGSMANLVGLAAAPARRLPESARLGLSGGPAPCFYVSTEGHLCLEKAVVLLGAGRDSLRKIETNADFRMDLGQLERAIARDENEGRCPVAVVAQGGAVNTGAVDPLGELADLCSDRGLWLHVDGAYGAPAAGTDLARGFFAGLERADSVAVDAHKWFQVPFTAGCVLVREPRTLRDTFSVMADYAESSLDDDDAVNLMEYGPQMSRGFQALKVWMTFLGYGASGLRAGIERNIETTRYLAQALDSAPDFERLTPATLSVLCFRYVGTRGTEGDDSLNRLNQATFEGLERDGRFLLGRIDVRGKTALRVCNVKYRMNNGHVDELLEVVRQVAEEAQRVHA